VIPSHVGHARQEGERGLETAHVEGADPEYVSTVGRLRDRAMADHGMTTAEYAVGTMAAVGFAGLLYKVVTSAPVSSALSGVIERALSVTL